MAARVSYCLICVSYVSLVYTIFINHKQKTDRIMKIYGPNLVIISDRFKLRREYFFFVMHENIFYQFKRPSFELFFRKMWGPTFQKTALDMAMREKSPRVRIFFFFLRTVCPVCLIEEYLAYFNYLIIIVRIRLTE